MLHTTTPDRIQVPQTSGALAILDRLATPQAAAVMAFTVLMAVTLVLALMRTGGHFTYTLDDPYIHLALAERLAHGHYGINPGEITSPSSSVIWPFLFIPGAGTAIHPYMPLALNFVLGAACAFLFGRFAAELPLPAGYPAERAVRIGTAALLVIATNQVGLAFTGMEHNLQVLVAVAAALGLIEHLRGRPVPLWAIVAAALGPAVRYELFAITAAVGVVLLAEGRWRHLAALCAGSLVLPAALSLFLVASGNHPLPNSVMLKLSAIAKPDALPFPLNIVLPKHWYAHLDIKIATWLMLIGIAAVGWRATGRVRTFCLAVLAAGLLHMLLGRFGWFYRYEVYAVALCALAALWLAAERIPRYVPYIALALAALYTAPLVKSPTAVQGAFEQQYQMHRFVNEHYRKSFAVNDLGWVSYRRDPSIHVLDLWGLASNEALIMARTRSAAWLDDITRRKDTGLAMIYREWFPHVPSSWMLLAELHLSSPSVIPTENSVQFYATATGDRDEIMRQLAAFKATLPPGVRLTFAPR
jgi:hypothetical protein